MFSFFSLNFSHVVEEKGEKKVVYCFKKKKKVATV